MLCYTSIPLKTPQVNTEFVKWSESSAYEVLRWM